jgi:signal transduction histidine kinase
MLTLHFTNAELQIAISDNGKGFTPGQPTDDGRTGAGLKNMEARARLIGGEMEIKSAPGEGTQILLNIPI